MKASILYRQVELPEIEKWQKAGVDFLILVLVSEVIIVSLSRHAENTLLDGNRILCWEKAEYCYHFPEDVRFWKFTFPGVTEQALIDRLGQSLFTVEFV